MLAAFQKNIILQNTKFTLFFIKEYDEFLKFIYLNEFQHATNCLGKTGYLKHRVHEGVTCYFLVGNNQEFKYVLNVWPKGVHHGDLKYLKMLPDEPMITCRTIACHQHDIDFNKMLHNETLWSYKQELLNALKVEPISDDEFKLLNIIYNLSLDFTYSSVDFYDNFFNKLSEQTQIKIKNIAEYIPSIKKHFI